MYVTHSETKMHVTQACVFRSVTQVSGPAPGSVMQKGRRTVIYKARDSGGLSDYCHFTVTVSGETVTMLSLHRHSVR